MKIFLRSILGFSALALYTCFGIFPRSANAQATIGTCSGSAFTNLRTCSTDATNYQVDVYRVELCTADPLSGSLPDFSTCTTLYKSDTPYTGQLASRGSFVIPVTGRAPSIPAGTYSHIALVVGNYVATSGSYGGITSSTTSSDVMTNFSSPPTVDPTDSDTWQIKDCSNIPAGDSGSRCEFSVNGNTAIGILTNASLSSTVSPTRIVYSSRFPAPAVISGDGNLKLSTQTILEVIPLVNLSGVDFITPLPPVFRAEFLR